MHACMAHPYGTPICAIQDLYHDLLSMLSCPAGVSADILNLQGLHDFHIQVAAQNIDILATPLNRTQLADPLSTCRAAPPQQSESLCLVA